MSNFKLKQNGEQVQKAIDYAMQVPQLSEAIVALQNKTPSDVSGLTVGQVYALDNLFKAAAYTKDATAEYAAFKVAFGIGGGGTIEPDNPENPDTPTKTLTGISAIYNGGNVAVGTAVSKLTDVVVTAHYSDGSTATVTGYTLIGTIAEGSNTVTVSYGGKTATFTVIGVAESGEEAEPLYTLESASNVEVLDRYNTADKPALLTVDGNDIGWVGATKDDGTVITNNIWYFHVNCSSASTNGVNGRTAPTWFTIPSGATVEVRCSNVSDNWNYNNKIGLNKTGNTEFFKFAVGGSLTLGSVTEEPLRSFTATMEEDTEINALVIDFGTVTETPQTVHVEVYVDGERWI